SLEHGDERRRGFWASWPQTGVPIGLALAALAVILVKVAFPGDSFVSIGWRIPFLLSAVLIIISLIIRLRILETPAFSKVKEEKRVVKAPLLDVFKHYWREIILTALIRSGEQAPFYIFTTFVLSYGVTTLKLDVNLLYIGIITAAVVAFVFIPTASYISDSFGRRRWYLIGTVIMAAFAFPFFMLLQTKNPLLVVLAIAVSVGICHAWMYGPQAAFISERFGTKVRYSGASMGYQLASLTAGGPAPLIAAALFAAYHSYVPIALYIIIMAAISLLATLGLKEYTSKSSVEDVEQELALPA